LGGLWSIERAWHTDETYMRCAGISRIVSEITALIRTDKL